MPGLYDASKSQATFLDRWFVYRTPDADDDNLNPQLVTEVLDLTKAFKADGHAIHVAVERVSGSGNITVALVRENDGSLADALAFSPIDFQENMETLDEKIFSDQRAAKYRLLVTRDDGASIWRLHVATTVPNSAVTQDFGGRVVTQDLGLVWTPADFVLGEKIWFYGANVADVETITVKQFAFTDDNGVDFEGFPDLTSVDFPNLTTTTAGTALIVSGSPLLTTITMPNFVPGDGSSILFNDNALTEEVVNALLVQIAANPAYLSGTVNLSGGTSAIPSGAGAAAALDLIGRGVSVTVNE